MNRLTRKSKISDMVWFVDHENSNMDLEPCEMDPHHNRLAIQKLAEYEDAEEQGLLFRLPCPLGTPVYYVQNCLAPNCKECGGFARVDNCYTEHKSRIFEQEFGYRHLKAFGKSVFLTKEEAEAALEKMRENVKMLKRYRFKTKSYDYRPLIDMKDIQMPWWCTGSAMDDSYSIIVCYLPAEEDLFKYWDDAYDIEYDEHESITYTSRFCKPDWID